ncbi:MAG: tRNA pseudouridine(55) synthase TruB [Fastidiosipilaceae bacterium]|nr:tRNA pseudouridine(55) synthase TruB [Clostridiaceae bacterium]
MALFSSHSMGGVLNINKAMSWTSFDVVAVVRKLVGVRRVGHCGTLDPFATGVLPVFIGRATGLVRYTENYDKRYRVTYAIGRETETEDLTGEVIGGRTPKDFEIAYLKSHDWAMLRQAVATMEGQQDQVPPMYSAVKVAGKRLYEYARRGETVERPIRRIEVYSANFVSAEVVPGPAPVRMTIDVHCSKGTYIRTLGSDLGRRLGFGAYAVSLIRTACGPYNISDSIDLSELEDWIQQQPVGFLFDKVTQSEQPMDSPLLSPESAIHDLTVIKLNAYESRRLLQGQVLRLPHGRVPGELGRRYRAVGTHGFLGVAKCKDISTDGITVAAERMLANLDDYQS